MDNLSLSTIVHSAVCLGAVVWYDMHVIVSSAAVNSALGDTGTMLGMSKRDLAGSAHSSVFSASETVDHFQLWSSNLAGLLLQKM